MRVVALSGWGQPGDALREVVPQAEHVDWAAAGNVDGVMALLAVQRNVHTLIGWSMGGMLSALAVARGVLRPQRLVLIASPFQFVQSEAFPHGMGKLTFSQYRSNLLQDAKRTLDKSYALIAYKDDRVDAIQPYLQAARERLKPHDWLHWLDAMAGHSFAKTDFSGFPPTLLVHGEKDVVIGPEQSRALAQRVPQAALHLWKGCGHAPHWHDGERLRALMAA